MPRNTGVSATLGLALVAGALAGGARADRTLPASVYLDKARGMWFGQLLGNHTGRPLEGLYCTREAATDDVFAWVIKTTCDDPWTGDDDTAFEYLYLHALESYGLSPASAEIQAEWDAHVPLSDIYIANRQAKYLMGYGLSIPATGSYRRNMHAYAIDAQITTEMLGALSPGQRQWALDTARRFGGVSNEGFALHAAEFYAALFAAAAFETDVPTLIALGQAAVPQSSRTWRAVQDVRDWYAADMLDGVADWRATRRLVYDYYCGAYAHGRYRGWIESTINVALTTLALLYGSGDLEETVRIAVLSGFDADCNAATAGGLIGLIVGFDGLPAPLTTSATDCYRLLSRPGLPEDDTISNIAARFQAVAEQVIVASGGTVLGGIYTIPAVDDVMPDPEMPDPNGPSGLVGVVLAAGRSVTVSASVEEHNPGYDRDNLESIIDGVVDVGYNGRLPYDTYDGDNPQPPGGDYYELSFSVPVRFDRLTFHEGDIRWASINADPRVIPPYGGYFVTLTVEVYAAGAWTSVGNLALSEPLDPFAFYQVIGLRFDSRPGEAVRIRGEAGGTRQCTSIVELAAEGIRIGDADGDGGVHWADWIAIAGCASGPEPEVPPSASCRTSFDAEADGDLDLTDLGWFQLAFGR